MYTKTKIFAIAVLLLLGQRAFAYEIGAQVSGSWTLGGTVTIVPDSTSFMTEGEEHYQVEWWDDLESPNIEQGKDAESTKQLPTFSFIDWSPYFPNNSDAYAVWKYFPDLEDPDTFDIAAYVVVHIGDDGSVTGTFSDATRIVSFTPEDEAVLPTAEDVDFTLHVYVNPDDIGNVIGVKYLLHNVDQNVLFAEWFSTEDLWLVEENATTSGHIFFATSTNLEDGNYLLEACIERTYFFGWVINPLSSINDCQEHQFVVGTSTFLGNLQQNTVGELEEFIGGLSATTTAALSVTCNPLSSLFGVRECLLYLLVPEWQSLKDTSKSLYDGVLTRVPWGYATRFVAILADPATSTLPAFTAHVRVGGDEYESITVDPTDMMAGGAALVNDLRDPLYDKSVRDIFEPLVKLAVALAALFTVVIDIMGSHKHANEEVAQRKPA